VTALHPVCRGARAPKHVDADEGAAAIASIMPQLEKYWRCFSNYHLRQLNVVPGTNSYEAPL